MTAHTDQHLRADRQPSTRKATTLKTKRERITFLLDHWPDYWETLAAHREGTTDTIPLLPRMAHHPSVIELTRALLAVRDQMPNQHAHLKAFYTAEWRTVTRTHTRKRRNGKKETTTVRQRERIIPRWVRNHKVDLARTHVINEFQGEPFIPDELLETAAA